MRPPPLDSVCGIPPRVMPQDCCTGIDKIAREEMFRKCGNECQQQGPCCHKNCIPREMGILSGSKVDKATALNSMKAAVGADNDWINVSLPLLIFCLYLIHNTKFVIFINDHHRRSQKQSRNALIQTHLSCQLQREKCSQIATLIRPSMATLESASNVTS